MLLVEATILEVEILVTIRCSTFGSSGISRNSRETIETAEVSFKNSQKGCGCSESDLKGTSRSWSISEAKKNERSSNSLTREVMVVKEINWATKLIWEKSPACAISAEEAFSYYLTSHITTTEERGPLLQFGTDRTSTSAPSDLNLNECPRPVPPFAACARLQNQRCPKCCKTAAILRLLAVFRLSHLWTKEEPHNEEVSRLYRYRWSNTKQIDRSDD